MSLFFERFQELCQEECTSPNAVAKKLGISSGSITAWKRGTLPRTETIQRLADYFHVSFDYLMGNVNDPAFHLDNARILGELNCVDGDYDPVGGAIKAALWGGDKDFTPEDLDEMWADVQNFAAYIASQRKKEKK